VRLASISSKNQAWQALVLLASAAALFLSIGKTTDDLRRSLARAFRQRHEVWAAWQIPFSGEKEVLPPGVNEALALMRAHKVSVYSLSPGWKAGRIPVQRLIEGGFPARPVTGVAGYYLGMRGEQLPPSCRVIGIKNEVFLADCR
jgi:hypothetical protein